MLEIAEIIYILIRWVARIKSQRRSEGTKASLERAKAKGMKLGRPPGAKDKRKRKRRRYKVIIP